MKKFLYLLSAIILLSNSLYASSAEITKNYPSTITANPQKSIDNLVGHFDNKIKIIFSDIDGTILPYDRKKKQVVFPSSVKSAVQKLQTEKMPLVLATGRSYGEAKEIAKEIGNYPTYIIAQQGAEIYNLEGKIIYQENFKSSDARKILKEINKFKKINKLKSDVVIFADGKPYSTTNANRPYNWEKITLIKSDKELKCKKISKIAISEMSREKLKSIQFDLKKKFPTYHIDLSSDYYCDITNSTTTKGNAVKNLAFILGIDLKNVAVLGDAENDITMLNIVKTNGGAAIATGNALKSVKDSANFITSSVYTDGFAKAVDKILKNNQLIH